LHKYRIHTGSLDIPALTLSHKKRCSGVFTMVSPVLHPIDSSVVVKLAPVSVHLQLQSQLDVAICHHQQTKIRRSCRGDYYGPIKRKRTRAHIHFAEDAIEFIENTEYLTIEDIEILWWTPKENKLIYQEAKGVVDEYRKAHGVNAKEFVKLFSKCANKSSTNGLLANTCTNGMLKQDSEDKELQVLDHLRTHRGLERQINPILSIYRNKYARIFLDVQANTPAQMEPEQKRRLLCAKSTQLTKPLRVLARLLAHGDSREVVHLIREELGK
jgi:hypothetical protein